MRLSAERHPEDPERDMAITGELLRAVAAREAEAVTRVFRPGPTVAFGRRDQLRDGFDAACDLARAHGYVPVIRHGGGLPVAYDSGSVIVEVITEEQQVFGDLERRFEAMAELIQTALAQLEVETVIGELPGEYCPGRFSIHLVDGPKIVGMAQRVISGASLTTASITVTAAASVRAVLVDVYAALGLPLQPATVGALVDRYPTITPEAVEASLFPRGRM